MQAFKADNAASLHVEYGQSLLDLVKAFEKVPYVHIIRAAIKHGYCLWTLRLSIQAYLSPRVITIDGICSRLIYAARGMTAGSGFAASELRCLFIDVCDAAYALWPSITLTLYVDDLAIEACGSASFVVSELTKATDFMQLNPAPSSTGITAVLSHICVRRNLCLLRCNGSGGASVKRSNGCFARARCLRQSAILLRSHYLTMSFIGFKHHLAAYSRT